MLICSTSPSWSPIFTQSPTAYWFSTRTKKPLTKSRTRFCEPNERANPRIATLPRMGAVFTPTTSQTNKTPTPYTMILPMPLNTAAIVLARCSAALTWSGSSSATSFTTVRAARPTIRIASHPPRRIMKSNPIMRGACCRAVISKAFSQPPRASASCVSLSISLSL